MNPELSTGVVANKKFDIYRRRAAKWGKCMMYIGYFLIIANAFGIAGNMFRLYQIFFGYLPEVKEGPDDRNP